MALDFTTFCFQGSLALFIALLAWGDQIRKPREAISEVEKGLMVKLKVGREDLAPIIHDSYYRNSDSYGYSLAEVTKAAVKLINSGKIDDKTVEMFKKIQELNDKRSNLEKKYARRYFTTILLSIWFGFVGILSFLTGTSLSKSVGGSIFSVSYVCTLSIIIIVTVIFINLVSTYFAENNFVRETEKTKDLIEVKE